MKIKIDEVKIRNFRSIEDISLKLKDCSVLVGKNNSGKSNILKAISYAFSFSSIKKEDVFVSLDKPFSFEKQVSIDVKILPINEEGYVVNDFDDEWFSTFGENVSIDDSTDAYFFAFRTEFKYDKDKEQYMNNKYTLKVWDNDDEQLISDAKIVSRDTISSIDNMFISPQRDLSVDIREKSSIFGKLISNIKITNEEKTRINNDLDQLNNKIVNESDILKTISNELKTSTADRLSEVRISPLTRDIGTICSGIDVYYETKYSPPTNIDNLGSGVRSWAVFSTIKAQCLLKKDDFSLKNLSYFPFTLVEEPEAHIHPQAQRQLYFDIKHMIGQKMITTHSPYILSITDFENIVYVEKTEAKTCVSTISFEDCLEDDIRAVRSTVMKTRGEVLFANAVILVEGETEDLAFEVFIREFFKKESFELGISVISVDGTKYLPFLRLLEGLSINWYIFSDGETTPLNKLKNAIKGITKEKSVCLDQMENVFYIPNGNCIEKYYMEQGYVYEVEEAFKLYESDEDAIGVYIRKNNNQICKKTKQKRMYTNDSDGGKSRALVDLMLESKTKYAKAIAEEIVKCDEQERRIPSLIKDLFEKVKEDLGGII